MKILVKPKTPFMLLLTRDESMKSDRPSVVTRSDYFDRFLLQQNIQILVHELPDEATDLEFEAFWKESGGDEALAIQSFVAKYAAEAEAAAALIAAEEKAVADQLAAEEKASAAAAKAAAKK